MKTFIISITLLLIAISNILIAQVNTSNEYRYDNLNRLIYAKTAITNGYTIEVQYTYDELGNRTSKTVTGVPIITKAFDQNSLCAGTAIDVVIP